MSRADTDCCTMKSVSLKVFPRALAKRAGVKKLRDSGRVPAVIYGRRTSPQNLEIGLNEIQDLIHHSVTFPSWWIWPSKAGRRASGWRWCRKCNTIR